jgi:hypothetical protein
MPYNGFLMKIANFGVLQCAKTTFCAYSNPSVKLEGYDDALKNGMLVGDFVFECIDRLHRKRK